MSKKNLGTVIKTNASYSTVRVTSTKPHPIYRKRITKTKTYLVNTDNNPVSVGDRVFFIDCPSKSKKIKWKIYSSEKR